ncbi:hypothetical protein D3C73_1576910 [compost metagenome]
MAVKFPCTVWPGRMVLWAEAAPARARADATTVVIRRVRMGVSLDSLSQRPNCHV